MEEKWKKWSLEETNCLLALWSSPEVQSKLVGATRTKPAYEQIQHGLSTAGYNRSFDQIVNRLKKLKTEYRELKKNQSGSEQPQSNPYFEVLDSVLGDRPACQLDEALNSSAAIVKVIVDDKVLQTFSVPGKLAPTQTVNNNWSDSAACIYFLILPTILVRLLVLLYSHSS